MSYFFKIYCEKVFWDMYYKYNLTNIMNVPLISKVIVNSCCGKFFNNKNIFNKFFNDLYNICLQKPLIIKSKKSISEFKLKKFDSLSFKITLRKSNMYNFLYKFLFFSISFIKNFKGFLKSSFDFFGNYNFGLNDHSVFLESTSTHMLTDFFIGLNINIIILNSNFNKSFDLLKFLNFPFLNV